MSQTKRIDSVDGLRALAAVAIVLYHLRPSLLAGGFVGVSLFFVIAGHFLAASVSRISAGQLGNFYKRRFLRLWPSLLACICVAAVGAYFVAPSLLIKVQSDALASAFFGTNILYIVRQLDYFAAAGLPSPVTHLWYLAAFMQFVLVWPLIQLVLDRSCKRSVVKAIVVSALAILTTIYLAFCYTHFGTSRAYYDPLCRSAELLCGVASYYALQHFKLSWSKSLKQKGTLTVSYRLLKGLGWLSLVAIVALCLLAQGEDSWPYYGGFLAISVLAAILLISCQLPGSLLRRLLEIWPLKKLGKISLSLYLVHYPLLIFLNPATRTTNPTMLDVALQLLIVLIASIVFYFVVEKPSAILAAKHAGPIKYLALVEFVLLWIAIACLSFAPINWKNLSEARAEALRPELKSQAQTQQVVEQTADTQKEEEATDKESGPQAEKVPANLDWKSFQKGDGTNSARVLIIGDSVTEGASSQLKAAFPNALVDGKVSRQLAAAPEVYAQDIQSIKPDAVVVALGTNSLIRDKGQVQAVIDMVQGAPLYFVTIRSPYPLQDMNNQILREYAAQHDNVGIIDWCGASEGHSEYLVDDGVHLTDEGIAALVKLYLAAF